jgi:hypothetical protein
MLERCYDVTMAALVVQLLSPLAVVLFVKL